MKNVNLTPKSYILLIRHFDLGISSSTSKMCFIRARIIFGFLAILATLLIACSAGATDYFLSFSGGNDQNTGTSKEAPWMNLTKISNMTFKPGDRIFLKRGDVWRSEIKMPSSGSETEKIILSAYGEGPRPQINASMILTDWTNLSGGLFSTSHSWAFSEVLEDERPLKKATSTKLIDGKWYYENGKIYYRPTSGDPNKHQVERTSKGAALWIDQKSNIIIDGLDFYGGNGAAVTIRNAKNIEVKNCRMTNSCMGVIISLQKAFLSRQNENIVLLNNEIMFNADAIYLFALDNGPYQVADRVTISKNTIKYTNYDMIWGHVTRDGHAIGIQNTTNSEFSHNIIEYNYTGIAVWTHVEARSDNNIFIGNYIHNNQRYGIAHGGTGENNMTNNGYIFNIISNNGSVDGPDGGLRINRKNEPSNFFVNNTLYANDINIYLYSLTDKTKIYNNISYYPKEDHVFIAEKVNDNYIAGNLYYPDGDFFRLVNSVYDFQKWKSATDRDIDSLIADPDFTENLPTNVNGYVLRKDSPAVGAGKDIPNQMFITDFAGSTLKLPLDLGALQVIKAPPSVPSNLKLIESH